MTVWCIFTYADEVTPLRAQGFSNVLELEKWVEEMGDKIHVISVACGRDWDG